MLKHVIEFYDFQSEKIQNILKKLGITEKPEIENFDKYSKFKFKTKLSKFDTEDLVKLQMLINAYSMKIIICDNLETRSKCLIIAKVDTGD